MANSLELELERRILELSSSYLANSACKAQGIGTAFRETEVFQLSLFRLIQDRGDEDNKDLRRSPQDARETGGIIIPHFRRSIYAVLCWPVNDETELGSKEDLVALPIFSNHFPISSSLSL
jgi:hypothetical protein